MVVTCAWSVCLRVDAFKSIFTCNTYMYVTISAGCTTAATAYYIVALSWQYVMYFLCAVLQERSTRPQFRAEGMPVANGKHAFVFTKIDPTATKKLQMKVKLSDEHSIDCPSKEDGATSANAERITDSQELVMLSMNGGLNTHRHILGHLIEC